MKLVVLVSLVLAVSALTDKEQWELFKVKYGKNYNMLGANEEYRFGVFQQNLRVAEKLSLESPQAVFGVTKFMDLTSEEFLAQYANLNLAEYAKWHNSLPRANLPKRADSINWVTKGYVANVKDQGQCGSCWAFSAAAAAEGCFAVVNSKPIDLSAQQVVDCCTAGGSDGCNGGLPADCLEWAMKQNISTEAGYTYTGKKGTCKKVTTSVGLPPGTCTFYAVSGTEAALNTALTNNVVSIAVDATPLQTYYGGIISGSTCKHTSLDHAVLLVGNDNSAYTVKNSWGADWGEKGYFRMAQNVNCLSVANTYASQAY